MSNAMSAIGPKRTSLVAPHMSALGGKADIAETLQPTGPLFHLIVQTQGDPSISKNGSKACGDCSAQASKVLLRCLRLVDAYIGITCADRGAR